MSTAFHPQTDGQTERANRTSEEMLRPTSTSSRRTGTSTSWRPSSPSTAPSTPRRASLRSTSTTAEKCRCRWTRHRRGAHRRQPDAAQRIQQLHRDLELAKEHLLKAQQRQATYADRHRREVSFKVGDEVLLSTAHLKLQGGGDRTAKFAYKYIGPFKIKRVVNSNAYELELPRQLQIHPVLNVSRLKAYHDGREEFPLRARADTRPPPAATSSDGDEYEVESILAKRGSGARTEYLVRWRGWPTWEATWERRSNLAGATDAVDAFETSLQNPGRVNTISAISSKVAPARDTAAPAPVTLHLRDDPPAATEKPTRPRCSSVSDSPPRSPQAHLKLIRAVSNRLEA